MSNTISSTQDKFNQIIPNPDIKLESRNIKSKHTDEIYFLQWNLPAVKTCPYATEECKRRCFAKKYENGYNPKINNRRNINYCVSLKPTFSNDMINYLEWYLRKPKLKNKTLIIRIHTSGDFYSKEYLDKWINISEYFKDNDKILFQAYTKSITFLMDYNIRNINIRFVYSIWHDTKSEHINIANKLELQTFTALPKNKIDLAVSNGSFLCNGDCGNCKECYTGKSKSIVIPYH